MDLVATVEELEATQHRLAAAVPPAYDPSHDPLRVAAVFVCFGRGGGGSGAVGDRGWSGAAVYEDERCIETAALAGAAGGSYQPGLLALREGALLAEAITALREPFDVLLVNATGRDHPRRAGLALHLGARFDVASVGVTHRPLLATGTWPTDRRRGARSPLTIDGEPVGQWVRTRADCRPLAAHAAWRTSADVAAEVALATTTERRTPEPLRMARRLARESRARETG